MLASGDSATFTGTTHARRRVLGVDIDWAYSPGEVKVLVSKDDANFEAAQCWRSTRNELTFKQSSMFPEPLVALAVTLVMRSPRPWKYFGINRLGLITEAGPVMLVRYAALTIIRVCLLIARPLWSKRHDIRAGRAMSSGTRWPCAGAVPVCDCGRGWSRDF